MGGKGSRRGRWRIAAFKGPEDNPLNKPPPQQRQGVTTPVSSPGSVVYRLNDLLIAPPLLKAGLEEGGPPWLA